jgi:hypothetical protein
MCRILGANASMRDVEAEHMAAPSFVIGMKGLGTDAIELVASATVIE